jgi:hypothetical protein
MNGPARNLMTHARGLYVTHTPEHGARYVWVSYGESGGEDVPEEEYRARGIEPSLDTLPSKDDYYSSQDPVLNNAFRV